MAKNKLAKMKVEADKKARTTFETGYVVGYEEGCEFSNKLWVEVCKDVKGVGPKLQAALIQKARELMSAHHADKDGKIRPEVLRMRDYLRREDNSPREAAEQ